MKKANENIFLRRRVRNLCWIIKIKMPGKISFNHGISGLETFRNSYWMLNPVFENPMRKFG